MGCSCLPKQALCFPTFDDSFFSIIMYTFIQSSHLELVKCIQKYTLGVIINPYRQHQSIRVKHERKDIYMLLLDQMTTDLSTLTCYNEIICVKCSASAFFSQGQLRALVLKLGPGCALTNQGPHPRGLSRGVPLFFLGS